MNENNNVNIQRDFSGFVGNINANNVNFHFNERN